MFRPHYPHQTDIEILCILADLDASIVAVKEDHERWVAELVKLRQQRLKELTDARRVLAHRFYWRKQKRKWCAFKGATSRLYSPELLYRGRTYDEVRM